jgi:hypothetical protein
VHGYLAGDPHGVDHTPPEIPDRRALRARADAPVTCSGGAADLRLADDQGKHTPERVRRRPEVLAHHMRNRLRIDVCDSWVPSGLQSFMFVMFAAPETLSPYEFFAVRWVRDLDVSSNRGYYKVDR